MGAYLVLALLALGSALVQAGPLWPLPKNESTGNEVLYLTADSFEFECTGYQSETLQAAFDRFSEAIFNTPSYESDSDADIERIKHLDARIDGMHVYVQSSDQSLNLETDESYTLIVQSPTSLITASSVYGALRGLETFGQLVDRIELPKHRIDSSHALNQQAGPLPQTVISTSQGAVLPERSQPQALASFEEPAGKQQAPSQDAAGEHGGTQDAGLAKESSRRAARRSLSAWDAGAVLDLTSQGVQAVMGAVDADEEDGRSFDDDVDDYIRAAHSNTAVSAADLQADGDSSNRHHHKHHKHHHHDKPSKSKTMFIINATAISDEPRYRHRGLLIDTSRHYLPLTIIKAHLDAMAASKMNVLHWHMVDDPSFPMVSERLPLLSVMGAFSPSHTYTREDVEDVISYARQRGIRVLPEFDTPGHTLSWGAGYPDLLTDCYDKDGHPTGTKGPMNPSRNETYGMLWKLLQEIVEIFPDAYLHLGGDEVPFDCWQSNPNIGQWMKDEGIGSYSGLEAYFEKRVLGLTAAAGRYPIVWQDVLDNGVELDSSTIAHVWKWWYDPSLHQDVAKAEPGSGNLSMQQPLVCSLSQGCGDRPSEGETPGWMHELDVVTKKGHRALLSAPWYLDTGSYAGQDWKKYYTADPSAFTADVGQQALLMGGEAAMWGEYTDATNSISKSWPRAAAVAERLWSVVPSNNEDQLASVEHRLHHHRCRLLALGLDAQPLGPGFCPQDSL